MFHRILSGWRSFSAKCVLTVTVLLLAGCVQTTPDPDTMSGTGALHTGPQITTQPMTMQDGRTHAALLLPLTGQAAGVGQALQNAAQMAAEELGGTNFTLMAYDTNGTPEGARRAAQLAIQNGADIILGPLFGGLVPEIAPLASAQQIPIISFTTDKTVVGQGSVFTLGFVPEIEVHRIVAYARGQGLEKFAVLAPDNRYGEAVIEATRSALSRHGGQLLKTAQYDISAGTYSQAVRGLTENVLFDALIIAEGGQRLVGIAQMLDFFGFRTQQNLGTGLWDDPIVASEETLVGGLYPAVNPELRANFERRYSARFGQAPPRITTLGYDAVALAAGLAQISPTNPYSYANLTRSDGFRGLDGIFRLRPDGLTDRGLSIMGIAENDNGVIEQIEISPPPAGFSSAGY